MTKYWLHVWHCLFREVLLELACEHVVGEEFDIERVAVVDRLL